MNNCRGVTNRAWAEYYYFFKIALYCPVWLIIQQQQEACKNADGAAYVTEYSLQNEYPATKEKHFTSYYSSVELSDDFYGSERKFPDTSPFVLCHVASTIKGNRKGHRTVIRVIERLTQEGYPVEIRFAGKGESVRELKQLAQDLQIEDRVKFVGFLTKYELKELLLDADLMLFPTKVEGLPRALIEAMATGLPCLSTPVSGIPELLPDDLLFPKDDVTGFTQKIAEIMNAPEVYESLSKEAFEKSKEYALEILEKRRNSFYNQLNNRIDKKSKN